MRTAVAMVLAGGEGRRLAPLTSERSKPAVWFGGRYRLIDFALSNLVNSQFLRITILTQYRATSLIRHLSRAWSVSPGLLDQYIDAVPAAMNVGPTWYRGTADAIWQNIDVLRHERPSHVLIFGADHVYKMDISKMFEEHLDHDADVTVSTVSIPRAEASGFGCVDVAADGRVLGFVEKPENPPSIPGQPGRTLVSMGNYVFRTSVLLDELRRDSQLEHSTHDFGRDVLATAHDRVKMYAYDFATQLCPGEDENSRGYWRDVGTIDSYFEANMDLVSVNPKLNLYNDDWPIRGLLPRSGPCKFVFSDDDTGRVGIARDSIVGSGAILSGGSIERTVCFQRVRVHSGASVSESVLFPEVDIGRGVRLKRCIVDKGVRIPSGVVIGEDLEEDRRRFTVSDKGIVTIGRMDFGQTDEFDITGLAQ